MPVNDKGQRLSDKNPERERGEVQTADLHYEMLRYFYQLVELGPHTTGFLWL
jgi:hypothetical protein